MKMGKLIWIALAFTLASPMTAVADDNPQVSDFWHTLQGGQLYDNWAKLLFKKAPEQTHPSYPAKGKQKGAGTWRCKECHGWDYRGRDGAYSDGKHATGIAGIQGASGASADDVVSVLKGDEHGFEDLLSDQDFTDLANFVSKGQVEAASAVGLGSFQVLGLIVIPQALRVIIPPLISQYLNLTKNSSLAIAIGYLDVFFVGRTIINQAGRAVPVFSMIMITYLTISIITSIIMNIYNRRIQFKER